MLPLCARTISRAKYRPRPKPPVSCEVDVSPQANGSNNSVRRRRSMHGPAFQTSRNAVDVVTMARNGSRRACVRRRPAARPRFCVRSYSLRSRPRRRRRGRRPCAVSRLRPRGARRGEARSDRRARRYSQSTFRNRTFPRVSRQSRWLATDSPIRLTSSCDVREAVHLRWLRWAWEREPERGPTAWTVFAPDDALVARNNAATNGKSEPHSPASARRAMKLVEHLLFLARGHPRTPIRHCDLHAVLDPAGANVDRSLLRSVSCGVFQQVDEHLFYERVIEGRERGVRLDHDIDDAVLELFIGPVKRDSHGLFDREPLLSGAQCAGFERRHIEQITNETVESRGLFGDGLEVLSSPGLWKDRARLEKGRGRRLDHGERRSKIVRYRAEKGIAQAFGFHFDLGPLRISAELAAFQRERDLNGKRVEKVAVRRSHEKGRRRWTNDERS